MYINGREVKMLKYMLRKEQKYSSEYNNRCGLLAQNPI